MTINSEATENEEATEDVTHLCIFVYPMNKSKRRRVMTFDKRGQIGPQMKIIKPYITDEEVNRELEEHGDRGFDKLPDWVKEELKARNLLFQVRQPTELEMWETVADAREHRIMNKQLTISDYQDKYIRGKSFAIL